MRKVLLVCAALIATLPASAAVRYVRGGFGFGFGPAYRLGGPWGYSYSPFYWGPYGMYARPNAGEVKLDTKVKDARVYLNGAYAGTAGSLKSMWLRQGEYNLELRSPDGARYAERIYVVNGKTLHVRPELPAQARP